MDAEALWRERSGRRRRARLVYAMAELAGERGFSGVSLAGLCAKAGCSRSGFYELFDRREDCFLAVLDECYERAKTSLRRALVDVRDWRAGLRTGIAELLLLLDSEPHLARAAVVEALAAGQWALERRERHAAGLTEFVVRSWGGLAPAEPHPFTHAGVTASLLGIVQDHLARRRPEPLIVLLGPLVGLATAPYLDPRLVGEEVARAGALARDLQGAQLPAADQHAAAALPKALSDPRARRAREVVLYLACHPEASNRDIARAVGISRDTQTSALLARLAGVQLLAKRPAPPGGANAWTLTAQGAAAVSSLQRELDNRLDLDERWVSQFRTRPPKTVES